uniref:Uncharacterized protein n=1 Tax=Anguilla anguilla TaxID=7936 RepID=A0A0E9T6L3_ANGAN
MPFGCSHRHYSELSGPGQMPLSENQQLLKDGKCHWVTGVKQLKACHLTRPSTER